MEGEQRPNQIRFGNGRPDQGLKNPFSVSNRARLALEATAVLATLGALAGCAPKEGVHPSQVPTMGGETPAATLVDPTLAPTEYVLPPVIATETSVVKTPTAPVETPFVKVPLVLPGIEPSAGGPDLIKNPLTTALQNVVNAVKFGVVAGENVSSQTGQSCITTVPEKLVSYINPSGEQLLKDAQIPNGIAEYDDIQVVAQVNVPADTEDATFSCALGYAVDNPDYKDGTLRQLLIKTNKADGSQEVIGSMQAGFSTEDNVEVINGAVVVNGETQGWTAHAGMELPKEAPEFKAGIPETLEECNRLELQYLPDGSIDGDWVREQMRALSKVEHAWLIDQGITLEDVAYVGKTDMVGGEQLPYPRMEILGYPIQPVSCTTIVDADGKESQLYGFVVQSGTGASISPTMIHISYDFLSMEKLSITNDIHEEFLIKGSPEHMFQNIHDLKGATLYIFLNGYGQNEGALANWETTVALMQVQQKESAQLANPQENGATPELMFFLGGKYKDVIPTAEEIAQWSKTIEENIYPGQTFELQ